MTSLREMQVEIKKYFLGESKEDLLSAETYSKLSIYKSLSFNTISSLLQNLYPLTLKVLRAREDWSEDKWRYIVLEYFENYPSKSAVLNQAAKDFSLYWSNQGEEFLAELAYYEWLQLEIRIMPESTNKTQKQFSVTGCKRIANFSYPISLIAAQLRAGHEPDLSTKTESLLIYRDRDHKVQSFQLSALTAYVANRLIALQDFDQADLESIYSDLEQMAGQQSNPGTLRAGFDALITDLLQKDILLLA